MQRASGAAVCFERSRVPWRIPLQASEAPTNLLAAVGLSFPKAWTTSLTPCQSCPLPRVIMIHDGLDQLPPHRPCHTCPTRLHPIPFRHHCSSTHTASWSTCAAHSGTAAHIPGHPTLRSPLEMSLEEGPGIRSGKTQDLMWGAQSSSPGQGVASEVGESMCSTSGLRQGACDTT